VKQSSRYARFIYIDEYKSKVWNIKCIHLHKVSYQKYAIDTNVYIKWINNKTFVDLRLYADDLVVISLGLHYLKYYKDELDYL
jgi:hypothetical protein